MFIELTQGEEIRASTRDGRPLRVFIVTNDEKCNGERCYLGDRSVADESCPNKDDDSHIIIRMTKEDGRDNYEAYGELVERAGSFRKFAAGMRYT